MTTEVYSVCVYTEDFISFKIKPFSLMTPDNQKKPGFPETYKGINNVKQETIGKYMINHHSKAKPNYQFYAVMVLHGSMVKQTWFESDFPKENRGINSCQQMPFL